eukprot:5456779-Lingulodinium_polyedra.AAC.1
MLLRARCSPVVRTFERARVMQIHWCLAKPCQTRRPSLHQVARDRERTEILFPFRSKTVQRRVLSGTPTPTPSSRART